MPKHKSKKQKRKGSPSPIPSSSSSDSDESSSGSGSSGSDSSDEVRQSSDEDIKKDTSTENGCEFLTEGKLVWTKRINDNDSANEEQDRVIKDLEEVLSFLKSVKIKNEEALVHIKQPLEDLKSSLKYLPIRASFDGLPEEVTTHILSYLCDGGAFIAASVCQQWKEIVKRRFSLSQDPVSDMKIGKHCSNFPECEDNACFQPAEILKASATHKLDIPLTICHSVTDVDPQVLTGGLMSVSSFTIDRECKCEFEDDDKCDCYDYPDSPVLSSFQIEDLVEGLDKRVDAFENVDLTQVDMTSVDQDKLVNCLLSKIKCLTLDEGPYDDVILDIEVFVRKLKQTSTELALKHLTLHHFDYTEDGREDLKRDMAYALCQVENVKLDQSFPIEMTTLKRLIDNILTRPVVIKSLHITRSLEFRTLISAEDLRRLIEKMESLHFCGSFTPEQIELAKTLPQVVIRRNSWGATINKCIDNVF